MPQLRPTEGVLRSLTHQSRQQFVCRTCRAHFLRQLHSSPRVLAEEPLLKRIQNTLFGSKESKEKERKRQEAQQEAIVKAAQRDPRTGMRIKRKNGVKYQIAPIVDQTAMNRNYTPAQTWDGLEHIGGTEYVKNVQDRGEPYQGFMPSKRTNLTDDQMAKLIHHIAVEVLALQKAGRDLDQICHPRSKDHRDWRYTRNATVTLGDNGDASLTFPSEDCEGQILGAIPKQVTKRMKKQILEDETALIGLRLKELSWVMVGDLSQYPEDSSPWMDMKLKDSDVKLAIMKRLLQLTGTRPSDHLVSTANTLRDLYAVFKAREQPKKLIDSEALQALKGPTKIPNLTVYHGKRTMIDKERAVGRWKVIEQELMKRDLPVTGSRWQSAKPLVVKEWMKSI